MRPTGVPASTADRPDRLIRDNPVLLLPGLQSPESVAALIAEWNPGSDFAAGRVADGVRWHGPFRLTPMLRADAGLTASTLKPTAGWYDSSAARMPAARASGGVAYVAEVRRNRVKLTDSRRVEVLRGRYPHGIPVGAEANAWHLVSGLAKRLRGAARLPGSPLYVPNADRCAESLPRDDDLRVFSHEMLPWIVLREVLRPLAPDLSREVLPDGAGYVLRQRDILEVRVGPADQATEIPYAIRDRADEAWPHSVYEFRGADVIGSATLIAEITGGVLLDADGFLVGQS